MNPTRVAQVFFSIVLISVFVIGMNGCKKDAVTNPAGTTVTPITDDLFPLTAGHVFTYKGYATAAGTGAQISDPTNSYTTFWTILTNAAPSPLGGTATAIKDSTRGPFGPGGFVVGVSRTLLIKKDPVLNDFFFMQSIGPFKRAFGITVGTNANDTLVWVPVARGSMGVGSTGAVWTAFDSTFTGAASTQVRLQIFGVIDAQETITDSSTAHVQRVAYRSRTWRKITVGGSVVQDDATTSRLWLAKDIGPVQIRIVEDTENIGHFRAMQAKNF
jgi:hypothetical protein